MSDIFAKLEALRRVDSVIDISRGWLQLRILLSISADECISPSTIASNLGERKKSVIDALRKLKLKGLVEYDGKCAKLSSFGIEVINYLMKSLGLSDSSITTYPLFYRPQYVDVYSAFRSILSYIYLYETIVALATAPRKRLDLNKLSSIVKLSPERLDDYLKHFTSTKRAPLKRRILSSILFHRKTRIFYELTEEGIKLANLIIGNTRIGRNKLYSLLVQITGTAHPRLILKRVALILSIGSAIVMMLQILLSNFAIIIMGLWITFVSFLALLVELSQ